MTLCNVELANLGIPTTIGTPGVDVFGGYVPRDLSLQNTNFVDALNQIISNEPDRRVFFDDPTDSWTFPSLTDAEEITININSVNIPDHIYDMSTVGRYTAVKLMAGADGRAVFSSKGSASCIQNWDAALENNWCMQIAVGNAAAGNIPDENTWVFRRWLIPVAESEINPNAPICAYVKYEKWGQTRYDRIDAYIDIHEGVVVTKVPCVVKGNPHAIGEKKGPDELILTWYRTDELPTYGYPYKRYPETGYAGTAYDLCGIEREKVELVDYQQLTDEVVQAKHALYKDIIISGTVTIEGDPIPELINLNKRIKFSHSTKTTGLETLSAIYTGYSYEFGKRGKNVLTLTTDLSGLLKVN